MTCYTHIHSLSLVLVVMMKSTEFKTKIYSHAHSLFAPLRAQTCCAGMRLSCKCSNERVTSEVCSQLNNELTRGKEHGLGQTLSHKPGALSSSKIGMLKSHWSLLKVTLLFALYPLLSTLFSLHIRSLLSTLYSLLSSLYTSALCSLLSTLCSLLSALYSLLSTSSASRLT